MSAHSAESSAVLPARWTPLYAVTVIVSACLLFLVQPLIAKIILPWFGGSAAVWSAALVFFQACVLGGYTYAHWLTTRVSPRRQSLIHMALLIASCLLMPIMPSETFRPDGTGNPELQILLLLTVTVGLPSLMLSSTSPLLQVWYMRRTGSEPPYWLFALSNAGSLVALLSFPLLLEPAFASRALVLGWSALFVVFAAMCVGVAYLNSKQLEGEPAAIPASEQKAEPAPTIGRMVLWLLLSACASGLLVTVSANLSANVAPIPLMWVVPLALYLLTFILAFSQFRFYHPTWFFPLVALSIACLAYLYAQRLQNYPLEVQIPLYLASMFIICMACHGELVARRPAGRYLTRFYLLVSLGGVAGGAFVGLIAPNIFTTYVEFPALLVVIAELYVFLQWHRRGARRTLWLLRAVMVIAVIKLFSYLVLSEVETRRNSLLVERNFYGTLSVEDDDAADYTLARRYLIHGTISHGYQYLRDEYRRVPASYFSQHSGVGLALTALQARGPVRMGVVGLGVGVLSGYVRPKDYVRLYEINPEVVNIADHYFTFLPTARAKGDVDVLLGDARLSLERQEPQGFDLLAIDAFSSDAIPTHLLTNEAFELYFKHLKPDGVLAVHISNRYIDLVPVCARAAEHVNRTARVINSVSDGTYDTSVWVLVTANAPLMARQEFQGNNTYAAKAADSFKGWTDEFSSVWPLLNIRGTAHAVVN